MIGVLVHIACLVLGYRRASIYWPVGISVAMAAVHLRLNWDDWTSIGLDTTQLALLYFALTLAINYIAYGIGRLLVAYREKPQHP